MPQTIRDRLEYLTRSTGRTELYRKQIADAYIAGELARAQAIAELGEEAVEDLDYARCAVERDVQWG